jgi:Fe-S-cluster-containing dehydrogenase component
MHFGDLDDPHSEVSRLIAARRHFVLKPDAGTRPRIFYLE